MSQFRAFKDKHTLIAQAEQEADKADTDYQTSVKYYFIARNFVAIYESRFSALPIQVWNEYRNALDHFFRYQTSTEKTTSRHIKKMEDHLLRAVLDVLKLFCHEMMARIEKSFHANDKKVLILVEDGEFITQFEQANQEARLKFEMAKRGDAVMGNDNSGDMSALNAYLDAAFAFDNLEELWVSKSEKIHNALTQYSNIGNRASKHTTIHHLGVHTLFYVLKAAVVFTAVSLGAIYNEELKLLTDNVLSFFK